MTSLSARLLARLSARVASHVSAFDQRVDAALEPWRDRRGIDRMFHLASTVGDFSVIWQIIGVVVARGTRSHCSAGSSASRAWW